MCFPISIPVFRGSTGCKFLKQHFLIVAARSVQLDYRFLMEGRGGHPSTLHVSGIELTWLGHLLPMSHIERVVQVHRLQTF